MRESEIKTYLIPSNFIDESRVLNGMIRTKYLIEAIILFAVVFFPLWFLIPPDLEEKLGITVGCALPLAMIALLGINGDALSTFVKSAYRWRKNKQVMLYNDSARTFAARPVDMMMAETNASEVIINSLANWRSRRAERDADVQLVENVDFVFKEDDEYRLLTPEERAKKSRAFRKAQKQAEKMRRRREKELAKQAKKASKIAHKLDKTTETGKVDDFSSVESAVTPEPAVNVSREVNQSAAGEQAVEDNVTAFAAGEPESETCQVFEFEEQPLIEMEEAEEAESDVSEETESVSSDEAREGKKESDGSDTTQSTSRTRRSRRRKRKKGGDTSHV